MSGGLMKLLVTGSCGFIGQNFVRLFNNKYKIYGLDKLDYASDKKALELCDTFIADIANKEMLFKIIGGDKFDAIVNFAAGSHVCASIKSPEPYMHSNIMGVFNILEAVREFKVPRFVQINTDEVYGDLQPNDPPFSNTHQLKPSNPYAASKAAADLLVMSYIRTYGIDALSTRSCNNYGPYQYVEKLIPVIVSNAAKDECIPIHGTGNNMREWIWVEDNCLGIEAALLNGKPGGIYHLGTGFELSNIDFTILGILGKPENLIKYVSDRPGNDLRYRLDCENTYKELNWVPKMDFDEGLKKTIEWYVNNQNYWEEEVIKSEKFGPA
jgi:dTDP-glucose 4,6-dehydratase